MEKTAQKTRIETLRGVVLRVTFRSEESGYTVLRLQTGKHDTETVAGVMQKISEGETIECSGAWVNDPKWGLQFHPATVKTVQPETSEGIVKYLSSGLVKGIGPVLARKLVDKFGEKTFDVIENYPWKLKEISDIGPKRAASIVENFREQKVIADIMSFLMEHGLGVNRAYRIFKTYGNDAIAKIKDNPYRLSMDIWGIGFTLADEVAQKLGISPLSEKRARAGLHFTLEEMAGSGHCASFEGDLVKKTVELLNIPAPIIENALSVELLEANLVGDMIDGKKAVYLPRLHRAEKQTAKHILRLMMGLPLGDSQEGAALASQKAERRTRMELNGDQRMGVVRAMTSKVSVLTGLPGTGKTTTLNTVLTVLDDLGLDVSLAAPTGRAAKRMTETTGKEAKTIHRLLEFGPGGGFKKNQDDPLETDFVVLDEMSMVDISLMAALLQAIPNHASVLLVGDIDQLPSVMAGNVLGDLISSESIPVTRLSQIYRQAASSRIVQNAHKINKGRPFSEFDMPADGEESDFYFIHSGDPEETQKIILDVVERIKVRFGYDPLEEIQVLTPSHKSAIGTKALNIALQERLNPHTGDEVNSFGYKFGLGDKVMQKVNDYNRGVFNGDLGVVTGIDMDEAEVVVTFEGREVVYPFAELDVLQPAWAVTIHKSQGSEYPAVVMPLSTQHFVMLERGLLYTGVTRAKRLLVVVGQPEAMNIAIKNVRARKRLTNLADRIRRECNAGN